MIKYSELGKSAFDRIVALNALIRTGEVKFTGHIRTKIYGLPNCATWKRIKVKKRVFFCSEEEALSKGYRPCSYCMGEKYEIWKNEQVQN